MNRPVTRRAAIGGAIAGGLTAALAPSASLAAAASPHDSRFVRVRNQNFEVAGQPFRFGGSNCYYLHQRSHYMIDSVLDDAAAMSLAVIRAWAFADGPTTTMPLQPRPFVYDEAAFDSLDYAVWKAGQVGVRLVLTLVNNWPDYGGMQQYVKWFLNLPDDSYGDAVNHDRFYTDARIRKCYRAYVRHVITRRNRYTGLLYSDDPTIMTFELANEPRNRSDKTGATVLGWVREMSAFIKHLAPRQLVAVGDEGFFGDATNSDYPYSDYEGDNWLQFLRLPHVDYGTFHLYPQGWGEVSTSTAGHDPITWGRTWITRHLAHARKVGKPAVLEEYGLLVDASKDVPDEPTRTNGYREWTNTVEREEGAGDQFWLLTSRIDDGSYYPDYDGYRIIWRNDDTNTTNDAAHLLAAHARRMAR